MAATSPKGLWKYLPIPLLVLAAYVLWRELHGINPNADKEPSWSVG